MDIMNNPPELLNRVLQRTTGANVARRLGIHAETVSRWKQGRPVVKWQHVQGLRELYRELYSPDPALMPENTGPEA